MTARLAALALAAAVACTPTPPPADSGRAEGPGPDTTVAGEVAVVGSAPVNTQVVIRTDAGRTLRIDGPLRGELGRLAAARVSLRGQVEGGAITPSGYDLLSVNGTPAYFGTVERGQDGTPVLRLGDGSRLELVGPAAQRFRPGQKVWVQGPASVRVQMFGEVTR